MNKEYLEEESEVGSLIQDSNERKAASAEYVDELSGTVSEDETYASELYDESNSAYEGTVDLDD